MLGVCRVILAAELALLNASMALIVLAPGSRGALWVGALGCGLVRRLREPAVDAVSIAVMLKPWNSILRACAQGLSGCYGGAVGQVQTLVGITGKMSGVFGAGALTGARRGSGEGSGRAALRRVNAAPLCLSTKPMQRLHACGCLLRSTVGPVALTTLRCAGVSLVQLAAARASDDRPEAIMRVIAGASFAAAVVMSLIWGFVGGGDFSLAAPEALDGRATGQTGRRRGRRRGEGASGGGGDACRNDQGGFSAEEEEDEGEEMGLLFGRSRARAQQRDDEGERHE